MFVWRNDAIGNAVGQAVLQAAERGVKVLIAKDLGAFMYERIEMNRKSFFNLPLPPARKCLYRLLRPTFPDTFCEDDFTDELGRRVMAHPNVTLRWVNHTHTKYYLFDGECLITGSINLEDRHRGYYDYMAEITGPEAIRRFRDRQSGVVPWDPAAPLDFLLNHSRGAFEIKPAFLRLIGEARQHLYIEMAYIGDPDISRAVAEASRRGVEVVVLFSRRANVGNDINHKAMRQLCRSARVTAYFSRKMIHSKLMLIDHRIAVFGSANFSVFSMQKAAELDLVVQDQPEFLAQLAPVIAGRIRESEPATDPDAFCHYSRTVAALQQLHQKLNQILN
jgi:cardiolipin synthase